LIPDRDCQRCGRARPRVVRERAWVHAYQSLSEVDRATPLGPDDLELLARSAYMLGRDEDYVAALAGYQRERDERALPLYELTCDFAKLEPPPPDLQQLIGAMQGNQAAMDDFVSVMAATLPAPDFFGPENTGRIMERAPA
jgi:hypothetical protein